MSEGLGCAEGMQPSDGASQNLQIIFVFEIGWMSALAQKDRKSKIQMLEHTHALNPYGRYHRQFGIKQPLSKRVLLEDGFIGPTIRSVKFGDDKGTIF